MDQNIAVIGCGYWGKNHIRCWNDIGALKGIFDSNLDLAKQKQTEFDVYLYRDLDEIVNDPDIKGVVIATTVESHYSIAKQCLLNKKDVLVEKPMTLHPYEAQELCSLARDESRILTVGHLLEYHPAVRKMRSVIKRGTIGEIKEIYSHRLNSGIVRQIENVRWSFAPHDLLLAVNTMKVQMQDDENIIDIDSIKSHGYDYSQRNVVDSSLTFFRFFDKAAGHIYVSWCHPYKVQKFVVVGTAGAIEFSDTDPQHKLKLFDQKIVYQNNLMSLYKGDYQTLFYPCEEPLKEECLAFLESIQTRVPPLVSAEDGLLVMKLLEAAEKSCNEDLSA